MADPKKMPETWIIAAIFLVLIVLAVETWMALPVSTTPSPATAVGNPDETTRAPRK